ncbi:Fam81b [Columba guinea]|nr:Fam81b [Columba guinea]
MALYSACRHQREKNNYFISLNRRLHMVTPGPPWADVGHNEHSRVVFAHCFQVKFCWIQPYCLSCHILTLSGRFKKFKVSEHFREYYDENLPEQMLDMKLKGYSQLDWEGPIHLQRWVQALTVEQPLLLGRDPSPHPQPGDRAHLLEERLSSQERTTAFLLHPAFRIKDDIVSFLQGTKGYQHGETAARRLLENHIQTITSIVKKLSQDIEVLERQIRTRDGAAVETNFAVQSLDHKYIHGLGDLRGRVARLTSILSDFRDQIQTHRKWTEAQLTRSEEDQAQRRQQLLNVVKERLLEQMDKPQKYEKQKNQMKSDEKNLQARISSFERQIWKELEEIQNEYRSGNRWLKVVTRGIHILYVLTSNSSIWFSSSKPSVIEDPSSLLQL